MRCNELAPTRTNFCQQVMKIALISQNIEKLNESAKVEVVKNYYRCHLQEVNVIWFQEHKLRDLRLKALETIICKETSYFSQKVKVAYNNKTNGDGAGSGGYICGLCQDFYT